MKRCMIVLTLVACGPPPAQRMPSTRTDDFPMAPAEDLGPRVSGQTVVAPDDRTREQVKRTCSKTLTVGVKLCVGVDGVPTSAAIVASSGASAYDAQVQDAVLAWRYGAQPAPVCTQVAFRYQQASNFIAQHCTGVHPD